jgi:hypothetical protein
VYDGTARVRISPVCRTLIVGMAGRYFNERDETGELKPNKGKYSHVCDASNICSSASARAAA